MYCCLFLCNFNVVFIWHVILKSTFLKTFSEISGIIVGRHSKRIVHFVIKAPNFV